MVATASVSETEQAKNVLAILSRVNSARDWMKKVKDLDALLTILAELKQFQVFQIYYIHTTNTIIINLTKKYIYEYRLLHQVELRRRSTRNA